MHERCDCASDCRPLLLDGRTPEDVDYDDHNDVEHHEPSGPAFCREEERQDS